MKKVCISLFMILLWNCSFSQLTVRGKVVSLFEHSPLSSATVVTLSGNVSTQTDDTGLFELILQDKLETGLVVSHVGYRPDTVLLQNISTGTPLVIFLEPMDLNLSEVIISTGYQQFNKSSTPGAVSYVSNEVLSRSMSTDILSRLEGVAGSLAFNRRDQLREESRSPELRVRGRSTLHGQGTPLIILDNFPFEGDLESINPNDVKDITLLKDAAAAAIWGAKAGNGVLIITTKKGLGNSKTKIQFTANTTITEKPDLFANPNFLDAQSFIGVERELVNRGFYVQNNQTVLSPVVEALLLNPEADLLELEKVDYRVQASNLFYRPAVNQQYFLSAQGGSEDFKYYFSGGYDKQNSNLYDNGSERLTMNASTNYKPFKNLMIEAGINFTRTTSQNNGLGIMQLIASGKNSILPYTLFQDEQGQPLAISRSYRNSYIQTAEEQNLLNWEYKPLNEIGLNSLNRESGENRLNLSASYLLLPGLHLETRFQYHLMNQASTNNYDKESYYVRNLVNRYTQQNGTRIIPTGNILEGNDRKAINQSLRVQLSYNKSFGNGRHDIKSVAGYERRETTTNGSPGFQVFGVDSETMTGQNRFDYLTSYPTRPQGVSTIPAVSGSFLSLTDRSLSYYFNSVYSLKKRYMFSLSARQDGSNLYGVKFKQKIVPLWSAGLAWTISNEDFYDFKRLSELKIRATYGFSGNVDRSTTAFPIVGYSTDSQTGLLRALLRSPGNPSLKWEKVQTINFGFDLATADRSVYASFDYYIKRGLDLLGDVEIDPTTGIGFLANAIRLSNRINYASTTTQGVDLELTHRSTVGKVGLSTSYILNYVKNLVSDYNNPPNSNILVYTMAGGNVPPVNGNPLDAVYSFKWTGLEATTGAPLVMLDGKESVDYGKYLSQLKPEQLVLHGSSVPRFTGSVRNVLTYKAVSLGFLLTYKAGYYYRESSISYYDLFNQWQGHSDFHRRWQQPGDEKHTQVPSMPTSDMYDASGRRDMLYNQSELLVNKGDHVRFQELNMSYRMATNKLLIFDSMTFNMYTNNLGIIWRKQKGGSDPDYPNAYYPPMKSVALGLKLEF